MEPATSGGDRGRLRRGGHLTDPNVPEELGGRAIGEYAAGLFSAFPDLSFKLLGHHATGDRAVAARWLMRGTNTGPLRGHPPAGATVALPGADFIAVEGDRTRSVEGYFDRSAFVEQLGLQVIVLFRLGAVLQRDDERVEAGAHQRAVGALRGVRDDGGPRARRRNVPVRATAARTTALLVRTAHA